MKIYYLTFENFFVSEIFPIKYHYLCINNSKLLCLKFIIKSTSKYSDTPLSKNFFQPCK